jgi:primosomal protein N' (replication factor Y)
MRNPYVNNVVTPSFPNIPTTEQKVVLASLSEHLNSGKFAETLLHGITGSGKTEIYLQLVQQLVENGKQAIVLVPEISLTPQMIGRFRARFGKRIAVMHSRLSLGERYDQWRLIRNDMVDVVVGVRSAVFAPLKRLGAIIVDEEHESTYKSEITPKYDAREIARQRCRQNRALLLLGTATPSVVTYHKALKNKSNLYYMGKRPNNIVLPEIKVIDMREELESGNRSILSKTLIDGIALNLGKKHQTILLLNRRGHSNFVLCRNCGYAVKCRNCNITMTYHSSSDRLICHYCGYTVKMPHACPNCGSAKIKFFGTGTQKVE